MWNLPDSEEYDFIRDLASRFNVSVRVEALAEGVRGYKIGREIVINSLNPPERRNWTFCHELGHIVLGHSPRPNDAEERAADLFAAETMLPERDFIPDSADFDLNKLKKLYPYASYEVLARRCLQFNQGVMTIFDNGMLSLRVGSKAMAFPPTPTDFEIELMKECIKCKSSKTEYRDNLEIKGFYIDTGRGTIRVILMIRAFPDI